MDLVRLFHRAKGISVVRDPFLESDDVGLLQAGPATTDITGSVIVDVPFAWASNVVGGSTKNLYIWGNAGHMYGIDAFGDPTPIVGQRLPEHQLSAVTSWWGQPNFTGYIYSHTFAQNLWASTPDTWGNADVQGTVAWCQRYGGQVVPALSATAAFIKIVGRERWAEQLVNLVRCWYAAPESVRAALAGQRIFVSIGQPEDYAMTAGFGAKAWARYGV